ncbi:MAG: NAD(+) synthase [Bacteroidia bacterium]|nr:NAD(+) synthase [Bacteroidia bacterium]
MKYIKVAGACVNQTPLDWQGNTQRLISAIQEARSRKVTLLCLPELSICGYGCEDSFFSSYILENSLNCLEKIARECEDITVSVGLPMEFENCLYNVCCLIQNQQILGFVAKQELAGDGVHYEPRWFKRWPNDLLVEYDFRGKKIPFGDLIFDLDGIRIGFEICEDAWNGVRPALDHYLRNVDIILNPSASHFAFGKTRIREMLVTETSRSYSCAYIYSNLLGNESGRIIYDGEILISQGGRLLARNKRFSFADFQIVDTVLDVVAIRRQKKKSFNFEPTLPTNMVIDHTILPEAEDPNYAETHLPAPDGLSKEDEFYLALTLGLFDYMRKSRSRGYVISLSGGADSSASAVLAAYAYLRAKSELGETEFQKKVSHLRFDPNQPEMTQFLTLVYQGTENSGNETLTSARELAEGLGGTFYNWNVQSLFDNYTHMIEASLGRELSWKTDDITLQNVQARLRAPGIWMMANINNALLITTSNRSEAAVGYATMDGDTAGGLAPLGGIDKAFLLKWLVWAEENLQIPALKYVNNLRPTAELRPQEMDQSDESDLMPYPILEKIERAAIRDYKSPLEVFKTLRGIVPDERLKGYVKKFFTLWSRNQWKRERYAPSFHLDDQNLDPKTWCRFPILSGGFQEGLAELEVYK